MLVLLIALNLGGVIYGPLDRWTGRRKLVVSGGILTQITLLSLLAYFGSGGYFLTVGLLIAFASVSQLHALIIAHAQSLFAPELAGRVITTTNIFMIGGIFVFQAASGAAYDFYVHVMNASAVDGYRLTFVTLAACQLIGLALYSRTSVPALEK